MSKLPADYKPPHEPHLLRDKWDYERIRDTVVDAVNDGLPVDAAFILAGVSKETFYRWKRECLEDLEEGYTGTRLIMLMKEVAHADASLFRKLSKSMMSKALEGDARLMMYLADNRFGYANKRRNTLELEAKDEDKSIEINIVNMTGADSNTDDDEDFVEVDYREVECGDDSNSTTLDT